MNWIKFPDNIPEKSGIYKVRYSNGVESMAIWATTASGKKKWLSPMINSETVTVSEYQENLTPTLKK